MSRKVKREIAKARQRNAKGRTADAWTMQRMAVDLGEKDTEIERLLRGINGIRGYLDEGRYGDASFDCEALLAGSAYEQSPPA